jgi:hypothetical protein
MRGEHVHGVFTTWIARQSTCEYMVWNDLLDFHEMGEVESAETPASLRGTALHNLLAYGTEDDPLVEFRDPATGHFLQWRDAETLRAYQANRLQNPRDDRVTEYSLCGQISGLQVRGTLDAFDLESGSILEYKTRARPTIPYAQERKNRIQSMVYYYLVKNYDKIVNDPDFPSGSISDYVKIQYFYQSDCRLLGEYVVHVPYEAYRFLQYIDSIKAFWQGFRPPTFNLAACPSCRHNTTCYQAKKHSRSGQHSHGTRGRKN